MFAVAAGQEIRAAQRAPGVIPCLPLGALTSFLGLATGTFRDRCAGGQSEAPGATFFELVPHSPTRSLRDLKLAPSTTDR